MPTTQAATSPDLEQERLENILVELLNILAGQDRLIVRWPIQDREGRIRSVTRTTRGGVVINVNF